MPPRESEDLAKAEFDTSVDFINLDNHQIFEQEVPPILFVPKRNSQSDHIIKTIIELNQVNIPIS